jgi:hypothetical protein
MFNAMMDGIKEESVGNLFNLQVEVQENPIVEEAQDAIPGMLFGTQAQQAPGTQPSVQQAGLQPGGAQQGGAQEGAVTPGGFGSAGAGRPPAGGAAPGVPGVTPGAGRRRRPAPTPPDGVPEPAAPPAAFGGNERRGRHAAGGRGQAADGGGPADGRGHATAAGRGQSAVRSAGSRNAGAHRAGSAPEPEPQDSTPMEAAMPSGLEPRRPQRLEYSAPSEDGTVEHHGGTATDEFANVGRNDICPCGSGKKYKRCHGDPRNA